MTYIVTAYVVMPFIVMTYIVMAYIVMACMVILLYRAPYRRHRARTGTPMARGRPQEGRRKSAEDADAARFAELLPWPRRDAWITGRRVTCAGCGP